MTNEEAFRERERMREADREKAQQERNSNERENIRIADRERAEKERGLSSQERATENSRRSAERKQDKQSAKNILESGSVSFNLSGIAKQDPSLARRLEREIRSFEQTGRVSGWLANETVKTENAQRSAQQAGFRQAVTDVVSTLQNPIEAGQSQYLFSSKKPTIPESPTATAVDICIGLSLRVKDKEVWVSPGSINGQTPSDFDPIEGKSIASGGQGYVWAKVEIDDDDGSVISREVSSGPTIPTNSGSFYYYTIGFYIYENENPRIVNYGCGSINVSTCRNWYTNSSPYFSAFLSR